MASTLFHPNATKAESHPASKEQNCRGLRKDYLLPDLIAGASEDEQDAVSMLCHLLAKLIERWLTVWRITPDTTVPGKSKAVVFFCIEVRRLMVLVA